LGRLWAGFGQALSRTYVQVLIGFVKDLCSGFNEQICEEKTPLQVNGRVEWLSMGLAGWMAGVSPQHFKNCSTQANLVCFWFVNLRL
jgi:hypothetical protein